MDYALGQDGVDGVLITGCQSCDCFSRLGNRWTEERIAEAGSQMAATAATAAAEAWDYISCARHRLGPHHFAKVFSDTTDCNSRLTQFAPTLSGFASHHMPRHHVTANDLAFFGEFHAA